METAESKIQSEVGPEETLLWSGRPVQGAILQASDARHIPFSLAWLGFAILWTTSVWSADPPFNVFAIFGIPFVVAGLYMVFGRFFVDARRRLNTYYGVTDKRVLILYEGNNRKVKSIELDTLEEYKLKQKKDGSGTILFGVGYPPNQYRNATPDPLSFFRIVTAFEGIPDVKTVYDLIAKSRE